MLNKQDKVFLLILVAITFILYANSFGNQLIWDNYFEIINNKYVQDFDVVKFFTKNYFAGSGEMEGFYRPIALLSFAVDYKIWGLNPFGFHLTNIILFILTAVIIYLFFFFGSIQPTGCFLNFSSGIRTSV